LPTNATNSSPAPTDNYSLPPTSSGMCMPPTINKCTPTSGPTRTGATGSTCSIHTSSAHDQSSRAIWGVEWKGRDEDVAHAGDGE
jgi:hypothetical protein